MLSLLEILRDFTQIEINDIFLYMAHYDGEIELVKEQVEEQELYQIVNEGTDSVMS